MSNYIGIRHEDKYEMEKRAPLTPKHVERLVKQKKLDIVVQTSGKRIFTDDEYSKAGAKISHDLKKCSVIFGVKEMPIDFFEAGKTYVFFSHVIKGQKKNMPMLKRMMELKCNLIDYERVVDEQGKRIIFFGRYAGMAGMINSLWALGLRLKSLGYSSNLLRIRQAHTYHSLKEAREDISAIGQLIAENGIPSQLKPFVVGFAGYGNVSQGAQEICGLVPVKEISAEKLLKLKSRKKIPENIIYKVVFHEEDMYERIDGKPFDLHEYFTHPELFRSKFEQYVPHLSMLINCIYWDAKFPKLLTSDYMKKLFSQGQPKLKVVGDISCDVNGSLECTMKSTEIEDPIFVYNPFTQSIQMGSEGEGLQVMAVDILPAELPRDSSTGFGDVLVNYVKPIADADFMENYEDLDLPRSIKKALVLHRGEFTPDYEYMKEFLND
ncbi:MAG TPA: bifunctional lysine ketoglutarate reductase /saccharopine dehydrogenase family protein [Bacteroidales bacterium]|nr:bifunctional lysine ketoglutarate reductase /saccharopine dehydrogenase family protein [Bacteroidales bacterium]HPS74174.1 bifunctional lysine ketoglutarate reductase /saccharopine dehydrogenase family protein [Bacteroidales bacterium]